MPAKWIIARKRLRYNLRLQSEHNVLSEVGWMGLVWVREVIAETELQSSVLDMTSLQ